MKVRKQIYLGSATIAIYINDCTETIKKRLREEEKEIRRTAQR